MDRKQFQTGMPGRLIETTGFEPQIVSGGVVESLPVRSLAFVPDPLPPELSDADLGRLLSEVVGAQTSLIRLENLLRVMPDPSVLLHAMRRREAIYSSRIENTTASARELALVDANQPPPRPEVLEVRNNERALNHGIRSRLPLSLRLIREMHEILLSDEGHRKQPGTFRSGQVHIHGHEHGLANARFVPPPPGEILKECLDRFERFLHRREGSTDRRLELPIELAMIHYQFECIHPFMDGNGRVGRLLIPLAGFKRGVVRSAIPNLSRFLAQNREEYCDHMLRVSTRGDWVSWIRFFCQGMVEDGKADAERVQALADLRDRYIRKITGKRTSILAHQLVDLLFRRQAITTAIVSKELNVTVPPAQKHIDRLVKAKILREVTGGNYNRVWVAEDIVRLIEADQPGST